MRLICSEFLKLGGPIAHRVGWKNLLDLFTHLPVGKTWKNGKKYVNTGIYQLTWLKPYNTWENFEKNPDISTTTSELFCRNLLKN